MCVSFVGASQREFLVWFLCAWDLICIPLKIEQWRVKGGFTCGEVEPCSDTAASWLFPQLKVITSPLCPHCTSESPRLTQRPVRQIFCFVYVEATQEPGFSHSTAPQGCEGKKAKREGKSVTSTAASPLISTLSGLRGLLLSSRSQTS